MSSEFNSRLRPQDQHVFSFGRKFFGKKLTQIQNKKEFVQILREKGLTNYLDRKIIDQDLDKLNRFSQSRSNTFNYKNFLAPKGLIPKKIIDENNSAPKIVIKANHFRNIKNPTKTHQNNEKNYVNSILVKPKYNKIQTNQKTKTLGESNKKNMKSMPMILLSDEKNEADLQYYHTLTNIASFKDFRNLGFDFLNESKSMNEIENEEKLMQEKMDYIKNFLGKENVAFKIRRPLKRCTSIEPKNMNIA